MKDFERRFLEAKTKRDRNAIFDDFIADIDKVIGKARSIATGKGIVKDPDKRLTIPIRSTRPGQKGEGKLPPKEQK